MTNRLILAVCLSAFYTATKAKSVSVEGQMWRPEYNGSMEEWYQCHGLPCEEYYEVQRKMKLLMKRSMRVKPSEGTSQDSPLVSGTIDGCIWLTPDQIDWLIKDTERDTEKDTGKMDKTSSSRQKRKALDFDRFPSFKWPEGKPIIYKFDGKHDESQRGIIRGAVKQWEENTCIRFQEVETNQDVQESHIMVTREHSGCHSYVGKTWHYPQQLNLQDACLWEFGISVHEFGHALGLWHEQMRFDRDQYIKVLYQNLGFYQGQFKRVDDTVSHGVPYDYGSVMHYSPRDGSANGQTVLESLDPLYQSSMGQRSGLSFFDAKIINAAYCSNTCQRPTVRPCQRGGYQDPNSCDRCRCPDGFSGPYCERLAPSRNANCGGEIYLRDNEVRQIISPGYGTPYQDFTECSWSVKAPSGQQVELRFDDKFGVFCHNQKECFHWVEVKYKGDKGMYGPRFCCYDTPKVMLRSEDDEIVIIFRTDFEVTQSYLQLINTGFKATVRTVSDSGPYTPMPTTDSTTIPSTSTASTTTTASTTASTTTQPQAGGGLVWACNFVSKDGYSDWCDMSQDRFDDFDWTINSGRTPSEETGPDRASSGKYYIFIEASNPRRRDDQAIIRLPDLNSVGPHCLRWKYHMYGFHINTLQVFTENQFREKSIVWAKRIPFQDQTSNWLEGQVDMDVRSGSRLGFIGIRGDEFSGDIGLDDISVRRGSC